MPHVIVADDAFALDVNLMKPYPGQHAKGSKERVLNYSLSRARRTMENVFGTLSAVFRVLRKPIQKSSSQLYTPPGSFDTEDQVTHTIIAGNWRRDTPATNLLPIRHVGRRPGGDAKDIREEFSEYFQTDIGMVPWQKILS
nr:unnamed protein product [Callosobruchus analis]